MWAFYLISFPLTIVLITFTIWYFAVPNVPRYVLFTVGYTWFCSLSIIILVPPDVWTTISGQEKGGLAFLWSFFYWSTFFLTWVVVPTMKGYEDAGDFTVRERLKTSVRNNFVFNLTLACVGIIGIIILKLMRPDWNGGILGLAKACSNTFGLFTGAFLLGFGMVDIPGRLWKSADPIMRHKTLSHKIAKVSTKLDKSHQKFSKAIRSVEAISSQISNRDPRRPHMNVIDDMLRQILKEDPSLISQIGRLGEHDTSYDDFAAKSMATLRCELRIAREEYHRYKTEYMTYIMEALELEDAIKSYEHRYSTGWKYVSSFRPARSGKLGSLFDTIEFVWRCLVRKKLQKFMSIVFGCMSVVILLAEVAIPRNRIGFSVFSIFIYVVGMHRVLVQLVVFIPLMYMSVCTYYALFRIGMIILYSISPKQTSPISLLKVSSMVARYAPTVSYDFLNLIILGRPTIFDQRMGNIDTAVPFFGIEFYKTYPFFVVAFSLLVACFRFICVPQCFRRWKRLEFLSQDDNVEEFDATGISMLQKERSWLEEGSKVGEYAIPLVRDFNDTRIDVEQ